MVAIQSHIHWVNSMSFIACIFLTAHSLKCRYNCIVYGVKYIIPH